MSGEDKNRFNLLMAISILFIPAPWGYAAAWEDSFTVPLTYEYQTNPTLSAIDEQPISKLVISPAYTVKASQDLNTWTANLLYKIERSSKTENSQDREYPNLTLAWNRILENGQMGITAHYDDNSTRETEFEDSGQVLVDGSRKLASISANLSHSINEKTSFSINAGYNQTEYSNINLINYSSATLGTSIKYKLNSKIEPFITLNNSRTDKQDTGDTTYVQSLSIGTSYSATEKLNFIVSGSVNKVKATTERTTKSASFTMNYKTEFTQSSLSLSRSLTASGATGSFVESDQLNGSWGYAVSETSNLKMSVNARENRDFNKNRTVTYGINYSDKLSALWDWRLSAQHRNLSNTGTVEVNNNIIGITLIIKTN